MLLLPLVLSSVPVLLAEPPAPLALHPRNPHYFLFRGKPAVLITSGEHYGAVLNLDFDQEAYLEELAAHGFNHTRLFSGAYRERPGSFGITGNTLAPAPGRYLCPWVRSETPGYFDGGNRFDLKKWDEEYFRRLRGFLSRAGERGIVVEVNLFCTMYGEDLWRASPLNAANNINGIGRVTAHQVYSAKEPELTAVQEALARKIASELHEFDNLYYEVCNEPYERPGVTAEWEGRIIAAIVEAEAAAGRGHGRGGHGRGGQGRGHLISVNLPHPAGGVPAVNPAVSLLNFHAATPAAAALCYPLKKALGDNETGGSRRDDLTYRAQGWEFLLAGGALFSHLDFSFATAHPRGTLVDHRGPGGGGPALRRQLRVLKDFIHGFDFVSMEPASFLLRGVLPEGARAQVLAEPGKQYAVYLLGGRRADLSLELPAGTYRAEWVNPVDGSLQKRGRIQHPGGAAALASPDYQDDIALRLVREGA